MPVVFRQTIIASLEKKKVLILVDWFLPGFKAGGPIQSCVNLIEQLKDDFEFSVVTRDKDIGDEKPYPSVKSDQWNTLSPGVNVYYFSDEKRSYRNLKKILLAGNYDVVYLNSLFSLPFTIFPLIILKSAHADARIVLAPRGMLGAGALAIKAFKKKIYLAAAKITGMYKGVTWHATSGEEKNDIEKHFGKSVKIAVAPNLTGKISKGFIHRKKIPGEASFIFLSRISRKKNVLAAFDFLQGIKNGKITFHVYGPIEDKAYWNLCLEKAGHLPGNICFSYKGMAEPSMIHQLFSQYHFMLFPTFNENFGHVILESLAAGCPVVISDQTPWRKLKEKNIGWDIPLAEKEEFSRAVETCARMTQEDYDRLSLSSFEFAMKISGDKNTVEQNRKLFLPD